MERKDLRFIQISDLHITSYRNLLEPMINSINKEDVDFVVATGDVADSSESIEIAANTLNKITHKLFVIPGDYDNGDVWVKYFGDKYKSFDFNSYHFEFLDTSFVRHRFGVGWANVIGISDIQQGDWLRERLKIDGYHIIFSHHPVLIEYVKNEFLCDNLRCIYSGHLHDVFKLYFPYDKPLKTFKYGFNIVPMQFHGNSCYLSVIINDNSDITNIPKIVSEKKTAW